MDWVRQFKLFTDDHIRQAQFFLVCRQGGIILSSVILARMMPVADVGIIEMMMLCGYFLTFFWSDALLKAYLGWKSKAEQQGSSSGFLRLYIIVSAIAMMVLYIGQPLLVPLITSRPQLTGMNLFILYQLLILPVWISPFLGILKGQNTLLLSLYVLIGPAFAVWSGLMNLSSVEGALIGLVCYGLVGFVWMLTKSKLAAKGEVRNILISIWPLMWPLVMYAISTGMARAFDGWLVARYFNEADFAIFRYGAREFPLVVALAAGLSTAFIPLLQDEKSIGDLRKRSLRLMHMIYPMLLVLMLLSPFLFTFVFGENYRQSALIFNICLLLALTQFVFPQSILIARGDTRLLWYVSLLELTVNVVASFALMQVYGMAGIVFGTVIAFAFEKIALLIILKRKYGIRTNEIADVRIWFTYIFLMAVFFITSLWFV